MEVLVARQPVFDADKTTFGYELLFQTGFEDYCESLDSGNSPTSTDSDGPAPVLLDDLTSGRKSFLKFTPDLLLKDVARRLPPAMTVIELPEHAQLQPDIAPACQRLKEHGYTLLANDLAFNEPCGVLPGFINIAKVDFAATTPAQREALLPALLSRGVRGMAKNLETAADFDSARRLGCSLFHGPFFSKPSDRMGHEVTGNAAAHMRLLNETSDPELSCERMEEIIRQDVSLTFKLLRFLNSAWFSLRYKVESIKHALILLGPVELRKWLSLVLFTNLSGDKPKELVINAMVRARACEEIGGLSGAKAAQSELFLMGMFSNIDALTDVPMGEVLSKLPLRDDVKHALLGARGSLTPVLDTVKAYEQARWQDFAAAAQQAKIDEAIVPTAFRNAWKWSHNAFAAS